MKTHILSAVLVICVFAGLSPLVFPNETEITARNWMTHPRIVKIRAIVNAIDRDIASKHITKKRDFMRTNARGLTNTFVLYADGDGNIRKVTSDDGSEDSHIVSDFYYDNKHILRFAFIKAGAVNGAAVEHRIYFDDASNRIWEIQKYTGKERYTFPETWPDEMILYDPLSVMAED
jgi:hypothetical protein